MKGLFITGTDTGIGKTVVAAAVVHRYRQFASLRYWKPIQTGIESDDDTATVRRLAQCSDAEVLDEGVRLPRPLSPHLAAELHGTVIDLDRVIGLAAASTRPVSWIVEGAGGVLAPINRTCTMIDLIDRLGLPAVVVARPTLGTINHTSLTVEALRNRSINVAGVVMVGEPNLENRRAIERYAEVEVLAEMPWLCNLTASSLRQWARDQFDKQGLLTEFLNA